MDAAGKPARVRRYRALKQIVDVIASRHVQLREEDPRVWPLPEEAHLGVPFSEVMLRTLPEPHRHRESASPLPPAPAPPSIADGQPSSR